MHSDTIPATEPFPTGSLNALLAGYQSYAAARARFLAGLDLAVSCRDPLSEFSERLTAVLLGAQIAPSRVQKGYDLIKPDGRRVQVKYLSNPEGRWVNEHHIHLTDLADEYALVIFVALRLQSVLIFQLETLGQVCARLQKRHPEQDTTLQLTHRNIRAILADPAGFTPLGVAIHRF